MSLLFTANKDEDIVNMIAAEVHVGTQNCNSQMESYIYDRTRDGVFYLDLAKTWEKTMVAARIIAAIQEKNPKDVLVSTPCCLELVAFNYQITNMAKSN